MSAAASIKIAVIAGEKSGDLLGADLISALRGRYGGRIDLIGVGGDAMAAQGLDSLFDYQELSIVGYSAVIARLPQILYRIHSTARHIIAARPDLLVIIDSPDFTHRVARRVRRALPNVPIVNYVCPTVWAWKPQRAPAMKGYIDHVLSILPFEPEIVARLGGPPVTYVGHRLMSDDGIEAVVKTQADGRQNRQSLGPDTPFSPGCCMLLPGSRTGEIRRLMPAFRETAVQLSRRCPDVRFILPTLPRLEADIRQAVATWPVAVEVTTGDAQKWQAFAQADAALAASGTVLLELALSGIPCISTYKLDPVAKLLSRKVTAWTVALPNFIADYPVVNEYINESVRPGLLARRLQNLLCNSAERRTMLEGFDLVRDRMRTEVPAGTLAADTVLRYLDGH